jgi:parvulin-like peptidyl-prolyl isomerase
MRTFCTIFLVLIFASQSFPQQDSVLAKVGNEEITVPQFRERFELAPQVYPHKGNPYDKKHDLLYSIIAEKLWAQQAAKLGYDTSEVMQKSFRALEKMYMRDALYKSEISSKIHITNKELDEGLKRYDTNLELNVIYAPDSVSIYKIYNKLTTPNSFDSLAKAMNDSLITIIMTYGEMAKPIEDSLYSLKVGEHTAPIFTQTDWVIFELANVEKTSLAAKDINGALKHISDMITKRKNWEYYDRFMNKFFSDRQVTADRELFWVIARRIDEALKEKKIAMSVPDTSDVFFEDKDLFKVEGELGPDTLQMQFINFKDNPYTVDDFLRYFIFQGFFTKRVDLNTVAEKLSGRVKDAIQDELLARKAAQMGLENQPKVRADINMWRDYYLAQLLRKKLMDSTTVTESEVHKYYEEKEKERIKDGIQVNVVEVLVDSLGLAKKIYNEVKHGASLRKLSKLYTKRKWTIKKNGELGLFSPSMYDEIGETAAKMKVGELAGPIKTANGYSVFRLIDKEVPKADPPGTFEKKKAELTKEYHDVKQSEFIIKYTDQLADKFGVSINNNMLDALSLQDLNMYAYRYMGFGGRIAAVPQTLHFIEWFKEWKNKNQSGKIVP